MFILFGLSCTKEYNTLFRESSVHSTLKFACFMMVFNMCHSIFACESASPLRFHIGSKFWCAQGTSAVIPVLSLDISC